MSDRTLPYKLMILLQAWTKSSNESLFGKVRTGLLLMEILKKLTEGLFTEEYLKLQPTYTKT